MTDTDRIKELEDEISRLREHLQWIADNTDDYGTDEFSAEAVAEHALWMPGYSPAVRPRVNLIKRRKPGPLTKDQQALYDRMWLRTPLLQQMFDRSGFDEEGNLKKNPLIQRTLDRLAVAAMNPGGDITPPADLVQDLYAATLRPKLRQPLLRQLGPVSIKGLLDAYENEREADRQAGTGWGGDGGMRG